MFETTLLFLTAPLWIPVSIAMVVIGKKMTEAQERFAEQMDALYAEMDDIDNAKSH